MKYLLYGGMRYLLLFGLVLALLLGGLFYASKTSPLTASEAREAWQDFNRRDCHTVAILDFTISDTSLVHRQGLYKKKIMNVARKHFQTPEDGFGLYLLHGSAADEQAVFDSGELDQSIKSRQLEGGNAYGYVLQSRKVLEERLDSLHSSYMDTRQSPNKRDSIYMQQSSVIGAIQLAALFLRNNAGPGDHRRVLFVSDMKHSAMSATGGTNTSSIKSKKQAEVFAGMLLDDLKRDTDNLKEIEGAEIEILTPNEHLYTSRDRNFRRMMWEDLFVNKLKARSVKFL